MNTSTAESIVHRPPPLMRALLMAGFALVLLLAQGMAQAVDPEPPTPRRPDAPALALPGPHNVGVTTLRLTHPDQIDPLNGAETTGEPPRYDRELTVELWYPARCCPDSVTVYEDVLGSGPDNPARPLRPFRFKGAATRNAVPDERAGPAPLVILSHGYPGSRVLMSYLGEHLASHGYLVAAIDHTHSTHQDRDDFASTLFHRPRDIRFVMDELLEGRYRGERLAFADPERTAVIGYSMGGYGALVAAGAGVAPGVANGAFVPHGAMAKLAEDSVEADARIRAVVALAPWGAPAALAAAGVANRTVDALWQPSAFAGITAPVLYVAGDVDTVSGYEGGVRWLWEQDHGGDQVKLLTYHQARHNVAPTPPPLASRPFPREFAHYAEPVWDIERLNDLNRHFITAFLARHLRDDESMQAYLRPWRNGANPAPRGFPPGTALGFTLERR